MIVSIGYSLYAAGPRFFELHRVDFGDLRGFAVEVSDERGGRLSGFFVPDLDASGRLLACERVSVYWSECTGEMLTPGMLAGRAA